MGQQVSIVGTVEANDSNEFGPVLKIKTVDGGARTIYIGEKYEGETPAVGAFGEFVAWEQDKKPTQRVASKYLNEFKPLDIQTAAKSNGNGHSVTNVYNSTEEYQRSKKPADEALILAQNTYNRSVDLACSGAIKVDEIEEDAKKRARHVLALAAYIKPELENPAWPDPPTAAQKA